MSQPVKLSDSLVLDARLAGEAMERSIAGQVEFWARIGRSVETVLDGQRVFEICRKGTARPVVDCIASADSPSGRQRVAEFLQSGPFPHYEAHPERPGLLVRIDENGERTTGRFVNRRFQAVQSKFRK